MEWQAQSKHLTDTLRLMVRPVGVCLLTGEESEAEKALRPGRDLGSKFTYCQAFAVAGRMGLPVMVGGEDEGCIMVLPAFGMGRFEPPEKIPQSQCAMGWVKDEETAMKFVMGQAEDVVPLGEYAALYAAPLEHMTRRPEVIMVYGTPAQVVRLVQGYGYTTGEAVESKFRGFGGTCVSGVLRTRRLGVPQVLLPGFGDRALARVEDHEMAFAFTPEHAEAILEGIEEVGKRSGLSWPMKYALYDTDFTRLNPVYREYVEYLERLKRGDGRMDKDLYRELAELIDKNPLGAPKEGDDFSPAFLEYLKLVYTPEEAELVRHLNPPVSLSPRYFLTAAQVAEASGRDEEEVRRILDGAAARGGVVGIGGVYAMPTIPLLVNAHQFDEEVGPDDLEASRLYQDYFIKGGFYKYYESSEAGTPLMRVVPVMRAIEYEQVVLDSEEAHRIIDACENLSLVLCPCRTRTEKLGTRECRDRYPVGACIMTELSALYFQNRGLGRVVTAEQAKRYLDEMQDLGLVAMTDNYSDPRHSVICLCCDCCCSQIRGRTRWENPDAVAPSNFIPVAGGDCVACGICVDRCFFGALSIDEEAGRSVVDPDKCIGCGVCAITCDQEALKLQRMERHEPPDKPRDLYRRVAAENRGGD